MVIKRNLHCLLSMVIILQLMVLVALSGCGWSCALEFMVGEKAGWSIPSTPDFYTNWSSSKFFRIGDILVFDFESGYNNVMPVSQSEYESCTASSSDLAFTESPVFLHLIHTGVFYFICNIANSCALGQKLAVTVHKGYYGSSSPSPSPSPSPLPFLEPVLPPTLAPLGSPEPSAETPLDGNIPASDSPAVVERSMSSVVGTRSSRVDLSGLVYCWSFGVVFAEIFGCF